MARNSPLRRALVPLVVGAVVLPIAICVILGVAGLLASMGDSAGGSVLGRIGLAFGILWVINLVGLLIVGALNVLVDSDQAE